MADASPISRRSVLSSVDVVADEFEQAWRNGEQPRIEQFLRNAPDTDQAALLLELLTLELELRRHAGEKVSLEDYRGRFGQHPSIVLNAFEADLRRRSEETVGETNNVRRSTHGSRQRSSTPTPVPAGQFGDYELIEEVARGGMGVVYRARQKKANRIVALKMILSGQLAGEEEVQRFFTEAEAAANLDHPNIVPIYDVGEIDGRHFFSMGFVEGQNLKQVLNDGPLPSRDAAELVKTIAEAVAYAHNRGIIHRDLKPANILLKRRPESPDQNQVGTSVNGVSMLGMRPMITDFGLAKQVESDSNLTGTGQVLGTPSYMPAEQAAGKVSEIGPASDVYSIGAILYEMLTGRPPFQSATVMETLMQVLKSEPLAPRQVNPSVDVDLETICLKCLDKEPRRRYQTGQELADEVNRFLRGEPILARPIGRFARGFRWCKRNRAVAGLSAAVATVLLMGLISTSWLAVVATREATRAREQETFASIKASEAAAKADEAVREKQRADDNARRAVASLVKSLLLAPAELVPESIEALKPFRTMAMPMLMERFGESHGHEKLHAAFGLAAFGNHPSSFFLDEASRIPDVEVANLQAALQSDATIEPTALIERLNLLDESDWTGKARLAILALNLGDVSGAMKVLSLGQDPTQRVVFVKVFPAWFDGSAQLARIVPRVDDSAFCSGICMALGNVGFDQLVDSSREPLVGMLSELFLDRKDPATHSAAAWALRRWNQALPTVERRSNASMDRDWYLNSIGVAMLKIPSGSFIRESFLSEETERVAATKSSEAFKRTLIQKVTLKEAFYLSDREVTNGLFKAFLDDTRGRRADSTQTKIDQGAISNPPQIAISQFEVSQANVSQMNLSPFQSQQSRWEYEHNVNLPVHQVTWYDAVRFCNWLSDKENLTPCYLLRSTRDGSDNSGREEDAVTIIENANGYRLPTEAEWEYACRAGTTSEFSFGDADELSNHAVKGVLCDVGSKMPNHWGLFDMHGNVAEWCQDYYGDYSDPTDVINETADQTKSKSSDDVAMSLVHAVNNPSGPPKGTARVIRGGAGRDVVGQLRSSARSSFDPSRSDVYLGFRIARSIDPTSDAVGTVAEQP